MNNDKTGILLLRTLTRKSILGFGLNKDLSIQNMIDLFKIKELLSIYYTCRNIDFCQDLKDELCIYGEREINKKEIKVKRYINKTDYFIGQCMKEMIDKKSDMQYKRDFGMTRKAKSYNIKHTNNVERALKSTIFSKAALRSNNQWK